MRLLLDRNEGDGREQFVLDLYPLRPRLRLTLDACFPEGAVAIRLDFKDTSFCFLTAHLAAGHSNVEERNADYFTISEGLHFSRGRRIADHDNVIWASDTNYRINLPNEEARRLAVEDNFSRLYEDDQVRARSFLWEVARGLRSLMVVPYSAGSCYEDAGGVCWVL